MSVEYKSLLTSLRRSTSAVLVGNLNDALYWIDDARQKVMEMRKPPLAREEQPTNA